MTWFCPIVRRVIAQQPPASEGPVDDRPANVESPDRWMGCMSLRDQAHELSDDWRLAHILGQKVRPESQQKCGEVETN